MHGNFSELVGTVISTEEISEHSETDESKFADLEMQEDLISTKFELDISMPSFEVEIMKLKLVPGIKQIVRPAVFENWVSLALIGMSLWLELRDQDSLMKIQINKISLIDDTMLVNSRLLTQTQNTNRKTLHTKDQQKLLGLIKHKLGTNDDFDEPALIVEKKNPKKRSPRFEGIYSDISVQLANI